MGYIPGEPDDGFLNGAVLDTHATNSAVVGSSNAESVGAEGFDPAEHTVEDVLAHLEAHPDERDAVLAAERDGKARVTLLAALDPDGD